MILGCGASGIEEFIGASERGIGFGGMSCHFSLLTSWRVKISWLTIDQGLLE